MTTVGTVTIVEFLRARLDEEERDARAADSTRWIVDWPRKLGKQAWGQHFAHWDPARVLREVEAKRRIVDECEYVINDSGRRDTGDGHGLSDTVLGLLALPYADHPDHDSEWRP